jgi:hypothetical protein
VASVDEEWAIQQTLKSTDGKQKIGATCKSMQAEGERIQALLAAQDSVKKISKAVFKDDTPAAVERVREIIQEALNKK